MSTFFPPFEPTEPRPEARGRRRIGRLPVRYLVPNLVTLLALCSGLTAIRMAMEGRYDLAIGAIVFAAVLDALDGRIARFLKSTSRFGAELDSLTDFVNFGVAPAILLYGWTLHEVRSIGWIAALLFAIAAALRLARFNVMLLSADRPAWQANFFVGVPAPAGAIAVLLPITVAMIDRNLDLPDIAAPFVALYTVLVGVLMVSRVPTFSGKKLGHVRRDLVVPLFVAFVLFAGLAVNFPFEVLAAGTAMYLIALPFGWRAWNRLAREHGAPGDEVTLEISSSDESDGDGAEETMGPPEDRREG